MSSVSTEDVLTDADIICCAEFFFSSSLKYHIFKSLTITESYWNIHKRLFLEE